MYNSSDVKVFWFFAIASTVLTAMAITKEDVYMVSMIVVLCFNVVFVMATIVVTIQVWLRRNLKTELFKTQAEKDAEALEIAQKAPES